MDKRILLGSIIAVVILVMVSFTGVVGYQTTKSSTIAKASPLFSVRSQRAIDEESKDLTCNYVGKGEETNLQFSSRIKRAEQFQKFIDIISKMEYKAFGRFVARIILHLKYQEQMTGKETSDALQALYNIGRNPNDMKYHDTENNPDTIIGCLYTFKYITCFGAPCLIQLIAIIFMIILIPLLDKLTFIFPHCSWPSFGC